MSSYLPAGDAPVPVLVLHLLLLLLAPVHPRVHLQQVHYDVAATQYICKKYNMLELQGSTSATSKMG